MPWAASYRCRAVRLPPCQPAEPGEPARACWPDSARRRRQHPASRCHPVLDQGVRGPVPGLTSALGPACALARASASSAAICCSSKARAAAISSASTLFAAAWRRGSPSAGAGAACPALVLPGAGLAWLRPWRQWRLSHHCAAERDGSSAVRLRPTRRWRLSHRFAGAPGLPDAVTQAGCHREHQRPGNPRHMHLAGLRLGRSPARHHGG